MTNASYHSIIAKLDCFLKQACVIGIASLVLIGCTSESSHQSANLNTVEKPVEYINYLNPNQKANGVLVKFSAKTNNKSRARSLKTAGLVASQVFTLVPGLTLAETEPGLTINQTLENLSTDASVAYAEPDYIVSINATPDDTDYSLQWGLHNNNDTDIDAPEAWDINTGSNTVVVAVIDSGVDYNHPDLRNRIWSNPDEIPNNGLDDDNNGFVDDVRGWDFESNSNDNDPMDEHNHGTHVSGIIGAQTNNARGIAGINWNIQIMPLKFMNARGNGATSAAIKAINYAVANGAVLSNNSWGGGGFSQALFDTIQAANQRGHLFIAAAGNGLQGIGFDTDNTGHYPSTYNLPNIISVAATDQQDQLTPFSNFGSRTVDLAAPGLQIQSTIRNGQYQAFNGTSMAAPFVTGVIGLLLAQNNTLTVNELKAAVLDNVDPIPALSGQLLTGGRLNAFKAITGITSTTPIIPVEINAPITTTLIIGDKLKLSATGGNGSYTWSSLTPNQATVDATGLVTAVSSGTARITATDGTGSVSNAIILSINGPTAITLVLNPDKLSTIDLNTITPIAVSGGATPYTWNSSNTTVANIIATADSSRASISADSVGTFRITVTDANGINTSSSLINISTPSLSINASKTTLLTRENLQLTVSGGTSPYTWNSSDLTVATVNSGGLVTAQSAGLSSITVMDIMNASKSINLQVIDTPSGNLNITPADSVINVGTRARLKATGGGASFTWISSDPNIASIDDRGIVNAVTKGIVQITVVDENSVSGTTNVEVRSINITAAILTIGAGDSLQLTVEGGKPPYQWKVSNTSIATIDDTGLLTSNTNASAGGILISVTDVDGISKSIVITINNFATSRTPRTF